MPGPVINTGNVVAIYYDGRFDGQQVLFTTHYKVTAVTGGAPELTQFYTAVNDKWSELVGMDFLYASCFTVAMTNIKRRVQVIFPNRYSADVRNSNNTDGLRPGTVTVPPANMAACLVLRSFGTAPQSKGTKHVLVSDVADVANGLVQVSLAGPVGDLGTALTRDVTLDAPAAGVTISPIIYHRADPPASEYIMSNSVLPTARVMRRRSVGQGT